jgi:hypothetical protein
MLYLEEYGTLETNSVYGCLLPVSIGETPDGRD